jgi:hypothetical protein
MNPYYMPIQARYTTILYLLIYCEIPMAQGDAILNHLYKLELYQMDHLPNI